MLPAPSSVALAGFLLAMLVIRSGNHPVEAQTTTANVAGWQQLIANGAPGSPPVGAGTLYRNFPTKQHLIADVVQEMSRYFEEVVAEASAGTSASDGLAAVIRAGFEVADQYGHLLLDLLAGGADRGFETGFDREKVRERVREICRHGIAAGELPASLDVEFALGMLQGLFAPRALEFLLESHTPHQIADLAVAFYLRGLGAKPFAGG